MIRHHVGGEMDPVGVEYGIIGDRDSRAETMVKGGPLGERLDLGGLGRERMGASGKRIGQVATFG